MSVDEPIEIHSSSRSPETSPNVARVKSVVLRDTARVRKDARHSVIRDQHTGKDHHDSLTIKTWKKRKDRDDDEDPRHSISLEGDEIRALSNFLLAIRQDAVEGSGQYVVLNSRKVPDYEALQTLINQVSASGKADALADVLRTATQDQAVFDALLQKAEEDPFLYNAGATTLKLAAFKGATAQLQTLIDTPGVSEHQLQDLLSENSWMFGSEYSELLDRRRWTRDENQDFVLRKTTDGYIEIVEIKTPLDGADLFRRDSSHDSCYAGADLSKVIGQVQKYIAKLDADRNTILANDFEDTTKIRAKIIIGRDGDEVQRHALRNHNGHLHRIEIITFDQLLKIAESIISFLESSLSPASDDDIDF